MKTIKKILFTFCVFALSLCLFVVPAFAETPIYPLPNITPETAYPRTLPDNDSIRFGWPADYGLIPLDGQSYFSTSIAGVSMFMGADNYIRVSTCAWLNGNLFTNFTIDNVYIDNVYYPSEYYSVFIEPKTGITFFEIDLERVGKEYQEVKIDYDIVITDTSIPDYISIGCLANDYDNNLTIDYIMLSAGYYLKSAPNFIGGGYNDGYNQGLNATDDIAESVFTVVFAPFEAITNFLDFEILGINLKQIFAFTLAVVIVVFIVKRTKD